VGQTRRGVSTLEVSSLCQLIRELTRGLGCSARRYRGGLTGTGIVRVPLPSGKRGMLIFPVLAVVLSQTVPKGEKHWNPLDPKQKSALELYDNLREKAGFDAWDVIYYSKGNGTSEPLGWSRSGERLTSKVHKAHCSPQPISRAWCRSSPTKPITSTSAFRTSTNHRRRLPTMKNTRIGKPPLTSFRNGSGSRVWVLNGKSLHSRFTQVCSFERDVLTDARVPIGYRRTITWIPTSLRTTHLSRTPSAR